MIKTLDDTARALRTYRSETLSAMINRERLMERMKRERERKYRTSARGTYTRR